MTVLVCEDDKNLLQLIELIISELNVEVVKCSDDKCLIDALAHENIDLIIIDYWLKKTKADSVIKKVKNLYPEIPIILMSAISNIVEVQEQLQVSDYLKKPFNIENFKDKVIKHLTK